MKKLITAAIIFIFIFNKEAYSLDTLRPQLIFAKSNHDILIKLGIKDLDSDAIAGVHIKTWLSEHKLFSHMPPLSLSSYLNRGEYDKYISDACRDRKLNETKNYILNYAIGLYETEQNPDYQKLLAWIVSLEGAFKENKAVADREGKTFKAKFVDYLTGRAGPHMSRLGHERSISPLEWAAQGRFFWQVHEKRHGFLFGKMDISSKPIGDLPLFPVDEKGLLDESLIQWMFKRDNAPPFKYYEVKKVSLRELLKIDNKDKTDAMQLKLDFTGQALASGHTTVNSSLGPEFGRHAIEKRWFFRMMSNKKLWSELEEFNSPYIEDGVRANIKRGTVEPMLPEHGRILDIMAGEASMFDRKDERIATGIGLVKSFMSVNPSLSDFIVRDLNNNPNLPVSEEFDAAVISFGIMYLTNPMGVLDSIRRHLKPGARIIIVFSGKYFDSTLAVNVFNKPEMYGYKDRVDVVESYIRRAGGFTDIKRNIINPDGEFVVISAIAEAISDRIETIGRQTGRDL